MAVLEPSEGQDPKGGHGCPGWDGVSCDSQNFECKIPPSKETLRGGLVK